MKNDIMLILGLTGSIAMGKSTTADMFREAGIPVYDADKMVHQLYEGEAVNAFQDDFAHVIENGKISRALLKNHLKNHPDDLQKIEAIIHPLVRQKQAEWLDLQAQKGEKTILLDIPLLFETGQENKCDYIIVVSAGEAIQKQRLKQRGTMNEAEIDLILQRQMADKEKCAKADFIVDTSHSIEDAKRQVLAILQDIHQKHR